ncbi:hypothetical protein ACMCNP_00975 [Candidatus Acidulodesulfobacterium sp. H_13]|uniref:hypothetical protein n=1 Tax=Candidatus Acidulodesulfobacterium sp. H_13 TaxID=3395470 RepID=UPI003AF7D613
MNINIWDSEGSFEGKTHANCKLKIENGAKEAILTEETDLRSSKYKNISKGEMEIKSLLNSGFIVKSDEEFLCNTYGFIDGDVRNNFNNLFLKNNFIEVQGASFRQMSPYGRNITVKNIVMSSEKFNEINSAKYANNYKYDEKFNNEYKLCEFTLKNYFMLKQNDNNNVKIKTDVRNVSPGIIDIGHHPDLKRIKYSINEVPSVYKFKYNREKSEDREGKKPALGIFKDYKETRDGFKNVNVYIDDKKVIEMESIYNWQKIMDYVKNRDMQFLKDLRMDKKGKILDGIEVHHINQLQDDGKDNVKNLIAISKNMHGLADSHKILIDKNAGYYREYFFNNDVYNDRNNKISPIEKYSDKLLNNTGDLDLSDKIFLNGIKLEVESGSAMRLDILMDNPEDMRLLFIDGKTGEELRLYISKSNDEVDKDIVRTALLNFVKDLPTSIG